MNIGILGCGAFGLALAHILDRNGCSIDMWTHNEEEKNELIDNEITQSVKNYSKNKSD